MDEMSEPVTAAELFEQFRRERRERAAERLRNQAATAEPAAVLDAQALLAAMADSSSAVYALELLAARMIAAGAVDVGLAAEEIARLRKIDVGRIKQARHEATSQRRRS